MNTKARFVLILTLVLLTGAALWATLIQAAPRAVPLAQGGAPAAVSYQGEVRVNDDPYTGDGYFKFAVVNAAGGATYWSNDGSITGGGEPTAAIQLAVSDGLFSVLLGDTTLGGMTQALTANVFSQPDRYLRVWFSSDNITFNQLTPDTRIAAVPYALQAQEAADAGTVDGYEGAALEESAEIDADVATHAAISDVHHARFTDGEAWAVVLANDGPGSGLDADTVDGLHASQLETHYQNVVVVAKSGGDYTGVQAAIDSISDAAADNLYLVWVAPGVYSETVTMKPYVHLQGAGQEATVITSTASSGSAWPLTQATLVLTSNASLHDLTVGNSGVGDSRVALLATAGTTRTWVADVTARALGRGTNNHAIFLGGSGTGVTLQQVTALAENGSNRNVGLVNYGGAAAALRGGTFTARGGTRAWGIFNVQSGSMIEADSITALAENGSDHNCAMYNYNGSVATLRGGTFTARGGNLAEGVGNALHSTLTALGVTALAENGGDNDAIGNYNVATATLSSGVFTARGGINSYAIANELTATMKAANVTALAENGSNNHGLWNVNNATSVLCGASLTGRGGTNAYGVYSSSSGTTLEAVSVIALGEDGSNNNYGLYNYESAAATLRGGSFTGRRGGVDTYGIQNYGSGTTLEAESVTALGEDNSFFNFGLHNLNGAEATLRGGSFTGRGGQSSQGISNSDSGTTLEAESVTALAENGSSANYGLLNGPDNAEATLHGGAFTGRGGGDTHGIYNNGTLEAENVTALGEDGSSENFGLYNLSGTAMADSSQFTGSSNGLYLDGGTVYLGVSQLDGGATNSSGTLTCYQVYDGSYSAYTCP